MLLLLLACHPIERIENIADATLRVNLPTLPFGPQAAVNVGLNWTVSEQCVTYENVRVTWSDVAFPDPGAIGGLDTKGNCTTGADFALPVSALTRSDTAELRISDGRGQDLVMTLDRPFRAARLIPDAPLSPWAPGTSRTFSSDRGRLLYLTAYFPPGMTDFYPTVENGPNPTVTLPADLPQGDYRFSAVATVSLVTSCPVAECVADVDATFNKGFRVQP